MLLKMGIPKLSKDIDMEQLLEAANALSCERCLGCCRYPGMYLPSEFQQLRDYVNSHLDYDFDTFKALFLDDNEVDGIITWRPKLGKDKICVFSGVEVIEHNDSVFIQGMKWVANYFKEKAVSFSPYKRRYCSIQEFKPLQCKIANCKLIGDQELFWQIVESNPDMYLVER